MAGAMSALPVLVSVLLMAGAWRGYLSVSPEGHASIPSSSESGSPVSLSSGSTTSTGSYNSTNWGVWMPKPLLVNQPVPAGSDVALAIFSASPVTVFVGSPGRTYESPSSSLPAELQPANDTLPRVMRMSGFTDG